MKTKKEEYIEKMAERLKEWSGKIDELESRVSGAASGAKTGYEQRIRELKDKREALAQKLSEVRGSSGEAWVTFKAGMDDAWEDFKKTLASARDKFKKAA